ncbi:carboxymuconolactone decarboxylase family protein [Rhizobacter sp. OV335]|uniref:carboxymuconolactone decarboxylase family protein n=1 Tax=Rhizobacter sp. OV335 TaxID=1500264 RepID=UPI0009169881|nr:carboxymuconolactone decarboxylase [Rhizobacter sp. OV335]SHM54231.1 Alkylhydroperoxidase family enzyme, contains CxxC motif [Rhizobacter sp. OV335]
MSNFTVHSPQSVPEASKAPLRALEEVFGFVPNLARAMAESPVPIKGFIGLFQNVHAGSFGEAEIQVLLLTNAVTNNSRWAIAFHTHLALAQGVAEADVEAIRARRAPDDIRHAALSAVARSLIENRGKLDAAAQSGFYAAGYRPDQLLELIGVVAASTLTNYAGNVVHPPLEDFLQATEATAALAASPPSSGGSD